MNTDKYARVTIVLEKETAGALRYVSDEMGVSVSELARGMLETPAAYMEKSLRLIRGGHPDAARDQLEMFLEEAMSDIGQAGGAL